MARIEAVSPTRTYSPMKVRVLSDAGAPVAGAVVTWTAPATGASVTFDNGTNKMSVTTGADGTAQSSALTGNGVTGTFSINTTFTVPAGTDPVPPPTSTPVSTGTKIIATHYFVPYPPSFRDPQSTGGPGTDVGGYYGQYLSPLGENSAHAYCGGLLRDRPITADNLGNSVTKEQAFLYDQKVEIQRMKAAGITATNVDLLSFDNFANRNWVLARMHLDAAAAVGGFQVFPMPDCTGGLGVTCSSTTMANALVDFCSHPAAAKVNGKYAVMPFFPDTRTVAFWTDVASQMTARGYTPTWAWCLNNYSASVGTFAAIPNTYAVSNWGVRSPNAIIGQRGLGTDAHGRGLQWLQPVAIQDERPNQSIYDEPVGSQALREYWKSARDSNAEGVQLITWNDYSECTQFSPSATNSDSWTTINKFYIDWFQSGTAPVPTKDFIALIHRKHHTSAPLGYAETGRMTLRSGSNPTTNIVECMTWLSAPASVTFTVGSNSQTYAVPAGEFVQQVSLPSGLATTPTASVGRGGVTTVAVTSRMGIVTNPYVEDFTYYATHNWQA